MTVTYTIIPMTRGSKEQQQTGVLGTETIQLTGFLAVKDNEESSYAALKP